MANLKARLLKLEQRHDTAGCLPECPPGMSYQEFCDKYANEFI